MEPNKDDLKMQIIPSNFAYGFGTNFKVFFFPVKV